MTQEKPILITGAAGSVGSIGNMLTRLGSARSDAIAQEHWTSRPPIK